MFGGITILGPKLPKASSLHDNQAWPRCEPCAVGSSISCCAELCWLLMGDEANPTLNTVSFLGLIAQRLF